MSKIGPLDWRISIVDSTGKPTSTFQRAWNNIVVNFTDLSDVPDSYAGYNSNYLQVNSDGTGIQFVTLPTVNLPEPTYQSFGDTDFTPTITNNVVNYIKNTVEFTATRIVTLTTINVTAGTSIDLFALSSSNSISFEAGSGGDINGQTYSLSSHSRRVTAVFDGTNWQLIGTNANV